MRIGVDALAVQSPQHGRRGIGRYGQHLIAALMTAPGDHQILVYAHEGLPTDRIPASVPASAIRQLAPDPTRGEVRLAHRMDRLARENRDGLDALLVLSPFEHWDHYAPPARPVGGPLLATVVHDLIPLLFQDQYLPDPADASWFNRRLRSLRQADLLLANSEATRADCLATLDLPDPRVVTVGAAGDGALFVPARPGPIPEADRQALAALGIGKPFVFYVGGVDPRKNVWGLIEAFALLPAPMREATQLVVTFDLGWQDRNRILWFAEDKGVGQAVVVTGAVPDATLLTLYQRCEAFCHPSYYEGFGLPILEAMHCGAPVIAGNNSSQREVARDAALLVNAADAAAISESLARVLERGDLADSLRARGPVRAREFSWNRVADRAVAAIVQAVQERPRARRLPRRRKARPRLAFLSPLPPAKSGVADYSQSLVRELGRTYSIDLYHAEGYVPDASWGDAGADCLDARLFEKALPFKDYRGIVYQMGNSQHHRFLYPLMLRYPGITTLHDFCLGGFHLWYGRTLGRQRGYFEAELDHAGVEDAEDLLRLLDTQGHDHEVVIAACSRRGAYLNRRVFECSRQVVVHSPWCVARLRERHPELAHRATVIPLGSSARTVASSKAAAIRARFEIPAEATVLAAFGFIHPDKMNPEGLRAFEAVAREHPSALLLLVGQEVDGGDLRRETVERGLSGRVRFLGRQSAADFDDLSAITDVGFNLRRPPTNGETSAALLQLLSFGVATIVTDVATFADFPDAVVRKVRWEADGLDGLIRATRELVRNREARESLGIAAREHVRREHDWAKVAAQYVEVIERCHAERAAGAA